MAFQPSMIAILGGGGNPIEGITIKSTGVTANFALYADGSGGSTWASSAKSLLTAKGDLLSFSTVLAKLTVGTNGQMLQADSTATAGLKWATVTGTGNITDINGDATAVQTLTVGTTGTDFAIVDDGTGGHAFNLPSASALNRGVVTTGAQTFGGQKSFGGGILYDSANVGSPNGFITDTDTGFYLAGANAFAIACNGARQLYVSSAGLIFNRVVGDACNFISKEINLNSGATSATQCDIINNITDGSIAYGGGNSPTNGGNVVCYGSTHATLASIIQIRNGSTVAVSVASTGAVTLNTTTDSTSSTTGTLIISGGVGLAKSLYQAAGKNLVCGNYFVSPSAQAVTVSGGATTIDLSLAAGADVTLGASTTLTLTNPTTGGTYYFRIIQGASSYTVTWPGTVKWPASTAPVITVTNGKMDLIALTWDGAEYLGTFAQNFG